MVLTILRLKRDGLEVKIGRKELVLLWTIRIKVKKQKAGVASVSTESNSCLE
jgi:hypothetical protein